MPWLLKKELYVKKVYFSICETYAAGLILKIDVIGKFK